MATLTVIPYKPLRCIIRKTSSKRIALQLNSVKKNMWFDFTDVPIEKLQASGGATVTVICNGRFAGDSKARVEDAQVSSDDLVGTQGVYSDYIYRGVRLCLMLYSSLDPREAQLR